jgi:hypothetical protein
MNAAITETATWTHQYQVSFAVNPIGGGSITNPPSSPQWYGAGQTGVSISASPIGSYAFSSWSSDTGSITFVNSTSASTTATIGGSGTITANFVIPPHYIDTNNAMHDTNVGSHSSFTNMQNDGTMDTLSEGDVGSSISWLSPTGNTASDWSDPETNAYDGNTGTRTSESTGIFWGWTDYLTLSYPSTTTTGVRYWVGRSSSNVANMEIQVYTTSWVTVYSGAPTLDTWASVIFASRTTTQVRFRFQGSLGGGNAYVYEVQVQSVSPANYQLDMEIQFSSVSNFASYTQLQIKTGTFNGETLAVYYWSGSWQLLTNSLTASTANTFTVSLSGPTFELRFYDTTRTGDTTQNTWQIDYVRLWAP